MTSNTATFSPNDVTIVITWNAMSHVVSGFSEDSIVTVEQNMPRFELYTGADNTNTRIHKNNTSATITIPLTQTSNSNDILSLLHQNDVLNRNSDGMFVLLIKDNSGRSVFAAREAFISVMPSAAFGNSMQLREWQIQAVKVDSFIGGNSKFDPADADSIASLGGEVDDFWRANGI